MEIGNSGGEAPDRSSGWLIVRRDGDIVTATLGVSALLRAPDPQALAGRSWTSLIAYEDLGWLPAARRALESGGHWRGELNFRYGHSRTRLLATIEPVERSDELSIINLEPALEPAMASPSPLRPVGAPPSTVEAPQASEAEASSAADLTLAPSHEAEQADHADGADDDDDPRNAARIALQTLHAAVPFDWATVLRYEGERLVRVLDTYPSPLGGIAPGATWPVTSVEHAMLAADSPAIEANLTLDSDPGSPFARLPALGLRSRLVAPLLIGRAVAGAVILYRSEAAFTAQEGFQAEYAARLLGDTLAADRAGAENEDDDDAALAPVTPPPAGGPQLESLGQVVAGVAHELNNPLTAILGYAQIMGSLDEDERGHALKTIEEEAQRAARIVRNLLSFARPRPGNRRPVDLEAVLRRVIDLRRYALETDSVHVVTRFGRVPWVNVDERQFEQAFLNLLNNAHLAVRGGGEIVISTRTRAGHLYISFADDGPGVPSPLRDRVFEPFFTTREVGSGEGMGLAIVYGVVTAHGGRTWTEPSPSGGAAFFVELPLAGAGEPEDGPPPSEWSTPPTSDDEPPPPQPAPAETTPSDTEVREGPRSAEPAPPHILVVDDEPPVRALTREILTAAGYRVTTAENGERALEQLAEDDFALVVTDLRMPSMGGAELYREIRERWPDLASKVLFVTGDIDGADGHPEIGPEAVHYLEKPFTRQQLLEAVGALVNA